MGTWASVSSTVTEASAADEEAAFVGEGETAAEPGGPFVVDDGGGGEIRAIGEGEHLVRDLARVRAKFGLDPLLASRSFDAAWTTEVPMEEDEAEFVDTMADCLGAGLSLEDALNCWDTGDLATEALDEGSAADPDQDPDWPDEPIALAAHGDGPPPPAHHRIVVR